MKCFAFASTFLSALVFLALLASPALASNPLRTCPFGDGYRWPDGGADVVFSLDRGPLGPLSEAAARDAVRQAFQVWESVATSTLDYTEGAPLPFDVDGSNFLQILGLGFEDGISPVVFDDDGSVIEGLFGSGAGVLGTAYPEWLAPGPCEILEAAMIIDGSAFLQNPEQILSTLVHEAGHFSGLGHTSVNGQVLLGDSSGPGSQSTFGVPSPADDLLATMYPLALGQLGLGGTKTTLHADDVAGVSSLYPTAGFATQSASVSGVVLAPDGETPVSGANVVARNIASPFVDAHGALAGNLSGATDAGVDPRVGRYRFQGLTPGAEYALYIDEIRLGTFSSPVKNPLPGPEEFYSGNAESSDPDRDDPALFDPVTVSAGSELGGIDIVFNRDPGGLLPLGIDESIELYLPFSFEMCGQEYGTVWVNSSGNLTFGAARLDFTPSDRDFLAQEPRLAPLWADLNPGAGGSVRTASTTSTFTVSFEGVPEFPAFGANSFSVTLEKAPARVTFEYAGVTATSSLVGVSCGAALTTGSGSAPVTETPTDLSATVPAVHQMAQPALWEVFSTANAFDLSDQSIRLRTRTSFTDLWSEKNDEPSQAKRLTVPFSSADIQRFTQIEAPGDIDWYRLVAEPGSSVLVEIVAGQLDTVIGLFEADGTTPLAIDDDGGFGRLSRAEVAVPASGEVLLAVTTWPDFDFVGLGNSVPGFDRGRYVLDVQGLPGIGLSLTEDGAAEVALDFVFPFQGQSWTSVWVNANGSLTFGVPDADWTESVPELLGGPPRVAPLWRDLSPQRAGRISYVSEPERLWVSFEDVPEYPFFGANDFSVELLSDGTVRLEYGSLTATGGLVGVSAGAGATGTALDLSQAAGLSASGSSWEQFFGTLDLAGLVLNFLP